MSTQSKIGGNSYQATSTADYFRTLPDEIIVYIFKFLPNYETLVGPCSQVCKRWNRLCVDRTLWRIVSLSSKDKITIGKLKKVLSFGVRSLEITFGTWEESRNQQLKNENQSTTQYSDLQYISFTYSGMTADIFANILSHCFNLIEITLYAQEINDAACQYIAKNKKLNILSLICIFGNVTAARVSVIVHTCTNVQTISFYNSNFSEEMLTAVFDAIPKPSVIQFMFLGNKEVRDKHVQTITVRCPDLVSLNLLFCRRLTSSSLRFITNGLTKLQYLCVCCNEFLLPQTLLQLKCLHNLTFLKISYELGTPFPIEIKEELQKLFTHLEIIQ